MIETIRRLLDFSGRCRKDLLYAFGYGVLYSVSEVIPVLAIVVALACITTAVALVSSAADFFSTLSGGKVSYRVLVVVFCVFSVASGAAPTRMPRPAMKKRSSTTLMHDDRIR